MLLHGLVAGGGLGGLSLAQALRRAGASVAVCEREEAAETAQICRIQSNQEGG